jgi:hypothetical protein
MKMIVEHRVLGAPVNDRGDGVLSVTGGVSERGTILLSDFFDSTSSVPEDHASMLFFRYPATGLYTVVHYQAKFTAFPEHNRWYDERAIYELNPSEFVKINYSFRTLLPALDKFGEYTTRYYGVSNEVEIQPNGHNLPTKSADEQTIKNAIIQGILNNKKVFIQLGEGDKAKGDAIRKSPKLNSLLEAVSLLSESWRKQVSVAYGVENHARVFSRIAPEILVFAIFDKVSDWGRWAANAIMIDWTGASPKGDVKSFDEQKLAVVGLLLPNFSNGDISSTQSFSTLVGTVAKKAKEFPDLTLSAVKSLSLEDVTTIEIWFNAGEKTYKHKDISLRLLWLSALGRTRISNKAILEKYPDLKNDHNYAFLLKEKVNYSDNFQQLADIYKDNKDIASVRNTVHNIVLSNPSLIDACADNPATDLAKDMKDKIRESSKKWTEDAIIARLDKPYFGLSIDNSFNVKSWKDYNRLYNKMENRIDISKLPFQISWSDVIPAELFKKIQNQLGKDDCEKLYDIIAPQKATLNDYAAIACNYGKKFYPFIKGDIGNALPAIDNDRFEKDVKTLLASPESKEIGEAIKNKHLAQKTDGLNNLIATLKNGCSDFLLKEITSERIDKTLNLDNKISDNQLVEYLDVLYGVKSEKLVEKRNLILKGLADRYIHKELLSETPLTAKSFWRLLEKPQKNVSKWFEIVADSISEHNSDDKRQLCEKYIDYYSNDCGKEQDRNVSKNAKIFVKKTTKNLVGTLQKEGSTGEAMALKSVLPKSFTTDFAIKIRDLGGKKLMIAGTIFAIIIGVVITVILLARGCDNKKKVYDNPKSVNDTINAVDTLYYKMLISDTIANSMEWESVPLHSTHPMLLFANNFLDSLYIRPVSAYVEMRVSNNNDSVFRLQIGSDSIWFVSRLLPILEYYNFVMEESHEKNMDTSSMLLKCIDGRRPRDTIRVTINNSNTLIKQILLSDTLRGCNVVSCNEVVIDNEDFKQRNGSLRTLGRTDYYLWLVQQMYSIKKHTSK